MNNWLQQRLELAEMNPRSQSLSMKYLWLSVTQTAQGQITSTFLILFLLDIINYTELGLLLAIQFGLTTLLDYPTSALADAIGHKYILTASYTTYALSLIFLLISDSFITFIPWAILTAIGISQESGALQSWYDNNYKATIKDLDPDRKVYGAFQGTVQTAWRVVSFTVFIIGGVIATMFSRKILFLTQLCLILIAIGFIILLMNNEQGIEQPEKTFKAYQDRLAGGLQFVITSRGTLFTFIGIASCIGVFGIWGNLMLIPFYAKYSGTDEYTGLLRALIYGTSIIWLLFIMKLSKKVKKPHFGLFFSYLAINIFFPLLVYSWIGFSPPQNKFNLITYFGVIIIFQFLNPMVPLQAIFQNRLMLDLVPERYRNAVYSLIPTLVNLINVPMVVIGGSVIAKYGFKSGLLLIMGLEVVPVIFVGLGLYWLANGKPIIPIPVEDFHKHKKDTITKSST